MEKNNVHHKGAYRAKFSDSLRDLQKIVLNYCENEMDKSKEILKWLDEEMAKKNELVSRQRAFLDEMLSRKQQLISRIIDTENVRKSYIEFHLELHENKTYKTSFSQVVQGQTPPVRFIL